MRLHLPMLFGSLLLMSLAVHAGGPIRSELLSTPQTAALGGDGTVDDDSITAFQKMVPNAGGMRFPQFMFGKRQFTTEWDPAPGQVPSTDGLGPVFNAVGCASCHINNGRGRPPLNDDEAFESILVRLSIPGEDEHGGPKPLPNYAGQLQHRGIAGVPGEGTATIAWEESAGAWADGTTYRLRKPTLVFSDLVFGEFPPDTMYSLRIASPVIGLGLLESVPSATLEGVADPNDADHDGISGRMNIVWDAVAENSAPGRFGWKANVPSVAQQNAGAALGDMGITTAMNPANNCPAAQTACAKVAGAGISGDEAVEFRSEFFEQLTRYVSLLGVPRQRHADDPQVRRGQVLFTASACVRCHLPTLRTGANDEFPELANQTIHPFTDLLLHDMGAGLADGRPDFLASGSEWRTAPLWGIGLTEIIGGEAFYLHDGRARSLSEAILWHGGEAQPSRDAFINMPREDRAALLEFMGSL